MKHRILPNLTINFTIKWVACIITLIGASFSAFNFYPYNIIVLNVGTVLYLIWSFRIREYSLVVFNIGILIIYTLGILFSEILK